MDIQAHLNAAYHLSSDLHAEMRRVSDEHPEGFLYLPEYMTLDAAISATGATLSTLRLLQASVQAAKAAI